MRPTIDEQLAGAVRLLRLAEDDVDTGPEATAGVAGLLRNARRLVEGVAGSWPELPGFLADDNARTAELLGELPGEPEGPGAERDPNARNEALRAALSHRVRELPAGPERAAIGAHLRRRVDANPA